MALEAASSFSSIHSADSPVAMALEAASSFSSIHSAASPVAMSTRSHSPASDFDRIQSPASSLDLFPSDVSVYICRCPSPCNLLRIHSPASSLDPAHSPASSFDHIHSVLKELETQCRARGLSQWVRRFKAKNDHDELPNSVCDNIKQLDTDWVFLIMFYESVDKWRKADDQEELKSNIQAIVSVARGIASDLRDARQRKKYTLRSRRALKLLKVLISDCQTKTEALMEEIGATVSSWSGCSFFLEGYRAGHHELRYFSNLNRYSRLEKLLESVIVSLEVIIESTAQHGFNDATDGNLNKQIYAFYDDLKCIQGHLDGLLHGYTFSHGRRHVTEKFLLKIASVAIRTANCSCNYWFNKKLDPNVARCNLIAGLLDVQHQIGPTNSNFVDLSLHSLRNLSQISTCPSPIFTPDVFPYSLVNGLKNEYLEQEVKSLVSLVIGVHTAWRSFKIEQRFIGETSALLVEVASYHGKACNEAQTDCSVLLIKICLLKVELFLMDKLNDEDRLDMIQREVERLNNALETLSQFSEDLPLEKTEYGIQTLALIEEVASLYRSCLSKTRKGTVFKVNDSSFQLFYKIVFFKAESFLEELLKSNITNLVACGKDKIEVLLEELKFFKEFLTYQNSTEAFGKVFQQVEKVARRITFFSYSFHPNKITEMRIEEMITAFDELFDKLKCIKAELRAFCPRFPMPNVPKICELLFIDFLINNIQELLKNDPDSIRSVKNPLTEIQQHLESLKSFLMEASKLDIEHPELKDLGNNIMRVVHKLDYVIDIKFGADWQHFFRFYDILNELRFVSKQASQIQMGTLNAKLKNVIQDSCGRIPWDSTREAGNEVAVNLRDQEEVIIDQLTRGSSKRAIVSIVGMPGIGKTTLARQVYNCQHVMYHFHRRAWCTVSQVYEKRELLLEILSDICGPTDEIHDMSNAELELKLRQCLLRNKYLIVMDDVWDIGAWHDLQISFPDDSNGSRILITTRLCNVALETNPTSEPHHLRPFSDEESWKLLKVKIFQDEFCPEELSLVGREIARQCNMVRRLGRVGDDSAESSPERRAPVRDRSDPTRRRQTRRKLSRTRSFRTELSPSRKKSVSLGRVTRVNPAKPKKSKIRKNEKKKKKAGTRNRYILSMGSAGNKLRA